MTIDDEALAIERWASDDGVESSHGVATAPLQRVYRIVMNTGSKLSGTCARKEIISSSRPIWLKRSGHIGEWAHHDMNGGGVVISVFR